MRDLFQTPLKNVAVLVLCGVLVGCGSSSNPDTAKVSGSVVMDGAPLTEGRVMFMPHGVKGKTAGKSATGKLDSDGNFTLGTYSSSDGAVVGEHKVSVISLPGSGEVKAIGIADPEMVTVEAGKSNTFIIEMTAPEPEKKSSSKVKKPGEEEDDNDDD